MRILLKAVNIWSVITIQLGPGSIEGFSWSIYFFIYIILFDILIPKKNHIPFRKVIPVCIICDFIPNIMELFIMGALDSTPVGITYYGYLFLTACVRTALVVMVLGFIRWNLFLLNKEEHEERYQNLYLSMDKILLLKPDVILIDLLMPEKDGIQIVKELKAKQCKAFFLMISQVTSKDIVGSAYDAGVDFFINKPINLIEVKSVMVRISSIIRNEKTINSIQNMLFVDDSIKPQNRNKGIQAKISAVLGELGMAGEKGCSDIIEVCTYLISNGLSIGGVSVGIFLIYLLIIRG